MNENVVPLNI